MLKRLKQQSISRLKFVLILLKFSLTPQIFKLITNLKLQLRKELKTKATSLIEVFYGFETGHNRKIIKKSHDKAKWPKENNHYVYKSKLVQKIINAMWFKNKEDVGVVFFDNFSLFLLSALALVLTIIDCCIEEWMTSIRTPIHFLSKLYCEMYLAHLKQIEEFKKYTTEVHPFKVLDPILIRLNNRGKFNVGAQPISQLNVLTIASTAFAAAVQQYHNDTDTNTDGEAGPLDSDEE
ncbi:hypothetical protein C0995_006132 [Termitomyces sp. Mi166|nr:hypothetical protein C0995_006132 [Termitomyces sp. Mi166\